MRDLARGQFKISDCRADCVDAHAARLCGFADGIGELVVGLDHGRTISHTAQRMAALAALRGVKGWRFTQRQRVAMVLLEDQVTRWRIIGSW